MDDMRNLRLYDLVETDTIRVYCRCGRIAEFPHGWFQRKRRIPSHTLVMDLQYRLRCGNCRAVRGFKITLFDERERGDKDPKNERVIVEGGKD
jgi:hypothetical protein